MAMIDYGALVFKNGKLINENQFFMEMENAVDWTDEGTQDCLNGNYFAYVGDVDAVAAFYKCYCQFSHGWDCVKDDYFAWWQEHHKHHRVVNINYRGMRIKFRRITKDVTYAEICYKDEIYHVIYGYGVDNNLKVWNEIKCRYVGVTDAKKIDNLILRYLDNSEHWKIKRKYKYYNRCMR